MRTLIISALAATLTGCTWFAPQQAQQASLMGHSATDTPRTDSNTGAKTEKAINTKTGHPRHPRKANSDTKIPKANRVPKMDTSSRVQPVVDTSPRVQPDNKSNTSINEQSSIAVKTQSTIAAKTETQQAAQPDDKSSTSINAQSTVAAKTQSTVAAKTETQQTAQPDVKSDPALSKAISAIAAKMQNSVSVELVEMKRVEKNAHGKYIDTICGYVRGKSASGLDTGGRPFLYLVHEDQAYIGLYDIATSPYHNLCDK